jgi:hypothetical protein
MTTQTQAQALPQVAQTSVDKLVRFLESSGADTPNATFAPEVFSDLTLPHWRVQMVGADELVAARRQMHPQPGKVRLEQVTGDARGYAVKLEERWQDGDQDWYCREGFICLLDEEGRIEDFTLYCTGDWSEALVREHAAAVTLIRP